MGLLQGGKFFLFFRAWRNSASSVLKNPVLRDLQKEKEFQALLERERARADRNGEEFSLIVFDVASSSPAAIPLAEVLVQRVRSTDIVGWFQKKMVVLLTDTPSAGAWKLADDIRKKMIVQATPITCTIYSYPFEGSELSKDLGSRSGKDLLLDSCPK
jgi:hypothetical protein